MMRSCQIIQRIWFFPASIVLHEITKDVLSLMAHIILGVRCNGDVTDSLQADRRVYCAVVGEAAD